MAEPAADRLLPLPPSGRTFTATRRARFGDLSPGGRLRLDALARYLQDVSSDDTTDAGLENDVAWVVRRTVIEITAGPRFRELLELTTFCSGTGGRWAERRVSVQGEDGAAVESVSLWVHLDAESGRPLLLPADFHQHYDEAAQGRTVSTRLQHESTVPDAVEVRPWPLRFADFDLLGHVNNAATWAMVEDVLADRPSLRPPMRAELEYRAAIERDDRVELALVDQADGSLAMWIRDADPAPGETPRLFATAVVRPIS